MRSLSLHTGTDRYVKECQERAQALKGRDLLLQQTLPAKEESKESTESKNEDGEETYISPTSLRVRVDGVQSYMLIASPAVTSCRFCLTCFLTVSSFFLFSLFFLH